MKQLNTIQAAAVAAGASAVCYVIGIGLFTAVGDFLRWWL